MGLRECRNHLSIIRKTIAMQYLIHTPSDVRELENLDISFEIVGPYEDTRIWPMVVRFETEEASAEAKKYGLVSDYPNDDANVD